MTIVTTNFCSEKSELLQDKYSNFIAAHIDKQLFRYKTFCLELKKYDYEYLSTLYITDSMLSKNV